MRDERDEKEREPEEDKRPPRRGNYNLETPFYEEEFDPYFVDQIQAPPADEDSDREVDSEDDWYWREPDNYWLEEGMWPWPEPAPRKKTESRPPDEIEPQE